MGLKEILNNWKINVTICSIPSILLLYQFSQDTKSNFNLIENIVIGFVIGLFILGFYQLIFRLVLEVMKSNSDYLKRLREDPALITLNPDYKDEFNLLRINGIFYDPVLNKKRGKYVGYSDSILINIPGTILEEQLPKSISKYGTLSINRYGTNSETKERKDIVLDLLQKIKKNPEQIEKIIQELYESIIISYHKDILQKRKNKSKYIQEAEKQVFGKTKKRITLTETQKFSVFEKYGHQCVLCNASEGLHIHHKDGDPSNNDSSNLLLLCGVCHKKAHMKVR